MGKNNFLKCPDFQGFGIKLLLIMETNTKMDFQGVEKYVPGAMGAFAYFLYMKIYSRLDWKRSLVALVTGVLMSAYLGPEVGSWLPNVKGETVGFLVGFLGMKLAEAFVGLDVKGVLKRTVEKPLK